MNQAERRLAQGPGAVFTPTQASQLIPGNDTENLQWLHDQGLISHKGPRPVVVWADVLKRLSVDSPEPIRQPRPQLARERL